MIDITQAIRNNNYRLTLTQVEIGHGDRGVILTGVAEMMIGSANALQCRLAWQFEEGIPAQKAHSWLTATYIKDGGFGFPERVDIIFDDEGFVFDLVGEPYKATRQPYECSICNEPVPHCVCLAD